MDTRTRRQKNARGLNVHCFRVDNLCLLLTSCMLLILMRSNGFWLLFCVHTFALIIWGIIHDLLWSTYGRGHDHSTCNNHVTSQSYHDVTCMMVGGHSWNDLVAYIMLVAGIFLCPSSFTNPEGPLWCESPPSLFSSLVLTNVICQPRTSTRSNFIS